jgi:CxxC-x17-CxxC domain-containing protein
VIVIVDRGGFGGGDRGARAGGSGELFAATCSSCHKSCEVPFRPSGDKPVYCSACFNKKGDSNDRGARSEYGNRSDSRREGSSYERPQRDARPAPMTAAPLAGLEDMKRQLATIESRLNRILDIINPPTPPTKAREPKKVDAPVATEAVVTDEVAPAPKKERKPKTVKAKAAPVKKAAKKAVKKGVKKAAKK